MHEPLFYVAVGWLALLFAANVVVTVRHGSVFARILAVDTAALLVVAVFLLLATRSGQGHYLDSAIVIAMLSFVETLVVSWFYSGEKERA